MSREASHFGESAGEAWSAPLEDGEINVESEISPEPFLDSVRSSLNDVDVSEKEIQKVIDRQVDRSMQQQFLELKKTFNRKLKRFLPVLLALNLDVGNQKPHETSFSDKAQASLELQNKGITTEQREAYKPGLSEIVYRLVTPKGYQSIPELLSRAPGNLIDRENVVVPAKDEDDIPYSATNHPGREDAWRMYLGLPQEHGTFGVSDFQPTNSKEDKYYYKVNDWAIRFARALNTTSEDDSTFMKKELVPTFLRILEKRSGDDLIELGGNFRSRDGIPWREIDEPGAVTLSDATWSIESATQRDVGIMGAFKLSKGQDEHGTYLSYYDRWDLGKNPVEGTGGSIGKPYEIYDRIYYNPWSKEIVPPDDELSLEVLRHQKDLPQ